MCIGDWRLGRLISRKVSAWNTATAATLTFEQNPQRVGIEFHARNADAATSEAAKVSIDGVDGFIVASANSPVIFSFAKNGSVSTAKFVISAQSGINLTGIVIEHFMPESYLAAGLAEFMSKVKP